MEDTANQPGAEQPSQSDEVLAFWREHGRQWALEEASRDDIMKLVAISQVGASAGPGQAPGVVSAKLQQIWNEGFSKAIAPYGWDEMNDRLPETALLAFVQGVEEASVEVKDKV
jgi:hypothetical protein